MNLNMYHPQQPAPRPSLPIVLHHLFRRSGLYQPDTITVWILRPCIGSLCNIIALARVNNSPNPCPDIIRGQAMGLASAAIRLDNACAHGLDVFLSLEYVCANSGRRSGCDQGKGLFAVGNEGSGGGRGAGETRRGKRGRRRLGHCCCQCCSA